MDCAKCVADQGSVYSLYPLEVKRGNKDSKYLKERLEELF